MNEVKRKWTFHPFIKFLSMLIILITFAGLMGSLMVIDSLGYVYQSDSFYHTREFDAICGEVLGAAYNNGFKFESAEKIAETSSNDLEKRNNLKVYRENLDKINKYKDIVYYIKDYKTSKIVTNVDSIEESHATGTEKSVDVSKVFDSLPIRHEKEANSYSSFYFSYQITELINDENLEIIIGIDPSKVDSNSEIGKRAKLFEDYLEYMNYALVIAIVSGILFVISVIYMFITTGKRHPESNIKFGYLDKIPADLLLVIYVAMDGLAFMIVRSISYVPSIFDDKMMAYGVIVVLSSIAFLIHLIGILSMVRRFKKRQLFKGMLCVRAVGYVVNKAIKPLLQTIVGGIIYIPVQLVLLGVFYIFNIIGISIAMMAYGFEQFLAVLAVVIVNTALVVFYIHLTRSIKTIREIIKQLSKGDLDLDLHDYKVNRFLMPVLEDLSNIHNAALQAGEKAVQNERFKVGLIANISHDLKTPLTSIITYVNLLDEMNLSDEEASKYVKVLKEKSWRMKELIEDVIDVNKTQTGNLSMQMTEIDAVEFLHQVLGEYDEKFGESSLTPVVNVPKDVVTLKADGNHLRRVFENIFENVVRYSLAGTRVYVNAEHIDHYFVCEVKNIAAEPINITHDEAKERFTRGDSSRSSEGSGLGLAIADGIIKQHHGQLEVIVDGDLFKVIIKIKTQEL